ncbi:hypothetical protein ACYATO_08660 [Lactobacillaceae bacterium Melli_B3]
MDPIVTQFIISVIVILVLMYVLKKIILHNRYKRIEKQIQEAPDLANNMQPGQKIVRTLFTLNDDQVSRFLAAFPANKFITNVRTRRIRQNNSYYNSYSTVITITKKS